MISTPPAICSAPQVFRAVGAASGNWSPYAEARATGSVKTSGLHGSAQLDEDPRRGRYALHFDVAVMGRSAEVYDGKTVWAQDISGGVHPYDAWFPVERATTDAYLLRRGYLAPHTGATFTCLGTRRQDNRDVLVIRIRPRGGISADVAVDAKSHLIASITEQFPLTTQVTRYADYRRVGSAVLPFSIESGTKAEPADGYDFEVQRYRLFARCNEARFSAPRTHG